MLDEEHFIDEFGVVPTDAFKVSISTPVLLMMALCLFCNLVSIFIQPGIIVFEWPVNRLVTHKG
jgi:hypothetical protein